MKPHRIALRSPSASAIGGLDLSIANLLDDERVARHLGVSPRYTRKLFERRGTPSDLRQIAVDVMKDAD
jgi:AraC-like DNA-binding protein